MESQQKIDDFGSSPSFSCYSSDSLTSKAVEKVIGEKQATQLEDICEDDFTFEETRKEKWTTFPVFNRDLDHEAKANDDKKIDVSVSITGPLTELFLDEQLVSSSSYSDSSSDSEEADDELENLPSGTFCVWRPKSDNGSSSPKMTKCKKSSSTGSRSKRWSIKYLLRRSNSEGKDPMELLGSKQKRNFGEVRKVLGRLKGHCPAHELFYVQRRAENEIVKRKSFLPYRQDLVKMFPF